MYRKPKVNGRAITSVYFFMLLPFDCFEAAPAFKTRIAFLFFAVAALNFLAFQNAPCGIVCYNGVA